MNLIVALRLFLHTSTGHTRDHCHCSILLPFLAADTSWNSGERCSLDLSLDSLVAFSRHDHSIDFHFLLTTVENAAPIQTSDYYLIFLRNSSPYLGAAPALTSGFRAFTFLLHFHWSAAPAQTGGTIFFCNLPYSLERCTSSDRRHISYCILSYSLERCTGSDK